MNPENESPKGFTASQRLESSGPVVSVIVPARNEERNLGRCLASLTSQQGIEFEVMVVDDASTDRTREIAESFATTSETADLRRVLVVAAPALPAGITGKSNACAAGADRAAGKWLLFTDADTTHLPGSLATAVHEAEERELAMLSYSPEQETSGVAQHVLMPLVFAELVNRYRPSQIKDPKTSVAAANGQYLLVKRETYERVGGHRGLGTSLLEDVELAKRVKASGEPIALRFGRDLVRTRMYETWTDMREGWTKNLALLFPDAQQLAIARAAEFLWMSVLPIAAVVAALYSRSILAIVLAALATPI